jgi:hypothetical protein
MTLNRLLQGCAVSLLLWGYGAWGIWMLWRMLP